MNTAVTLSFTKFAKKVGLCVGTAAAVPTKTSSWPPSFSAGARAMEAPTGSKPRPGMPPAKQRQEEEALPALDEEERKELQTRARNRGAKR